MPRPKIYCGNRDDAPDGYDRLGSRAECLRKGYGAALVFSSEEQRLTAILRMLTRNHRNIMKDTLIKIARNLGVAVTRANGTRKTKQELLNDITNTVMDMMP